MNRDLSTWRTWLLSLFPLLLLISGCVAMYKSGAPFGVGVTWSTTDLQSGHQLPADQYGSGSATVQWQVGNYLSDGYQIYGLLCIPPSRPGPYPVMILNHGLANPNLVPPIQGIGMLEWNACVLMAENGWLTAISTYRGEIIGQLPGKGAGFSATSGGAPELCHGEVTDVLNLLSAVTALPIANANEVLMWGHSQGSCITELAIEKGAAVQVAVSLEGPTDLTTWPPTMGQPSWYKLPGSSALYNPAALTSVKFLRIQAENDLKVPPGQACELASKLPGSVNYSLTLAVTPPGVSYLPPKGCPTSAYPMTWANSPSGTVAQLLPDEVGGTWPQTVLLVYFWTDGGDPHRDIIGKSWPEFASFVNAVAMSRGWSASIPAVRIQLD